MALHQRTVIRRAIRDLLLGETAAEQRVYASRVLPLKKTDLPAILVYPWDEEVSDDSGTSAPRELTRELSVRIEAMAAATDDVSDVLDALSLEIETAMAADPYLGGAAGNSILSATKIDIEADADRVLGLAQLTYDVTYRTLAPEPAVDADLDDFRTADAKYNLAGVQAAADRAHDTITVQEAP